MREQQVDYQRYDVQRSHSPECGVVAKMLGNNAADEHASAHAEVPRGEYGAVGCATLVVLGNGDNHVLESRPHVPVSKPDEDG